MTTFPGSPRLLKGAIVGLDPLNPLASVVVFQYNPYTLTHCIEMDTRSARICLEILSRLFGILFVNTEG